MTNDNHTSLPSKNEDAAQSSLSKNSSYEDKINAKRAYYLKKAEDAENNKVHYAEDACSYIESIDLNGQPILVGHHSETKHRNLLKKCDAKFKRVAEEEKKAEYYREKANSVGKGGISSDDENAIIKLEAKLAQLLQWQDTMKKANRQFKKGGWDAVDCLSLEQKKEAYYLRSLDYLPITRVFRPFELTNNNAQIKATQSRINELTALRDVDNVHETYANFEYLIDDNRLQFVFEGKPDDEVRHILKTHGFKWSPSRGAWVRKLTLNALSSAKRAKAYLLKFYQEPAEKQ